MLTLAKRLWVPESYSPGEVLVAIEFNAVVPGDHETTTSRPARYIIPEVADGGQNVEETMKQLEESSKAQLERQLCFSPAVSSTSADGEITCQRFCKSWRNNAYIRSVYI